MRYINLRFTYLLTYYSDEFCTLTKCRFLEGPYALRSHRQGLGTKNFGTLYTLAIDVVIHIQGRDI